MKNEIKQRVSNLNELRAEKLRLQSRMQFSREMIAENLNIQSLKNMALGSLPLDPNALISSGITKVFFGKNKGLKSAFLGMLVPLLIPKVTSFLFNSIKKRKK